MTGSSSVVEQLTQCTLLGRLPLDILQAISEAGVVRSLDAGELLFLQGDPSSGLGVVLSGQIKISRTSLEGREHVLLVVGPGDSFNEVSALDGGPNPATATAWTSASVLLVARPELQRLAQDHPKLAWTLLESMARRTRHLVDLVEDLSLRSVKGRLARLLLEQAEANASASIPRMLTHEEMASQLGTVREMVSRTLRSLAAEGAIAIDRHRILVLDREKLARAAAS